MKYVALLRGINVGGNNKVDMKSLKLIFEDAELENVSTYINSGNVIFDSSEKDILKLTQTLETKILAHYGFSVKVLIKSQVEFKKIMETLPDSWQNNDAKKCDVMFLWKEEDSEKVLDQLTIKPEIDNVKYISDAILWCVDRKNVTRSGMLKLAGTKLYSQMTIRNCNTVRKLFHLMNLSA